MIPLRDWLSREFCLLRWFRFVSSKLWGGVTFKPEVRILRDWPEEKDLVVCLESGRETDRQLGYTKHGAHRAEV